MYSRIFQILDEFQKQNFVIEEGWGYIHLKGFCLNNIFEIVVELSSELEKLNSSIAILIDDNKLDAQELKDFSEKDDLKINVNKKVLNKEKSHYHFFYNQKAFNNWLKSVDPLDPQNPINKYEYLKIIVNDLNSSLSSEKLAIQDEPSKDYSEKLYNLPNEKQISHIVHFVSEKQVTVDPIKHTITNCSSKNDVSVQLLKNAAVILTSSIINEFYSVDKVILRGIKRVQLKLLDDSTKVTLNFLHKLAEVVSWIYEDKTETRQKLFIDRVTLDINYELPLINELSRVIDSSFQQAKERYNFVIIDRKENYLKEVRDLLKDIKSQSDLYSSKIRNVLSNLLRDVLAGFLLVGFSIFTKISELTKLADSKVFLEYVFKGLAIYFLLSIIIQAIVDITDMLVSKREMLYWKDISREYIPKEEFDKHVKSSLKNRITTVWIFYTIIILCYLSISYVSWIFPNIWANIYN